MLFKKLFSVVICFHFSTFVVAKTTYSIELVDTQQFVERLRIIKRMSFKQ